MYSNYMAVEDTRAYTYTVNALRDFFATQNRFPEAHTQSRLSILAACEDPSTIATYTYNGQKWPLPQTGQMWLEYELLTKPDLPGVFCTTTSYRHEPDPIPGRHELIFPMFEFEAPGDIDDLRELETQLCEHLGFGSRDSFTYLTYDEAAEYYNTDEIEAEHEARMEQDFGPVVFLEHFPQYTAPFWNMKREGEYSRKIDVIICGQETFGSAERSTSVEEMRSDFQTLSGGEYAQLLYDEFGKERVDNELEEFLSLDFFPRYGGGIGMTRLINALKKQNLLPEYLTETDSMSDSVQTDRSRTTAQA